MKASKTARLFEKLFELLGSSCLPDWVRAWLQGRRRAQ